MLNKEKHQLIMGRIFRDIYSEITLAPLLGLKGGSCAYFFYGLPRFSVDLDFDLFSQDETTQKMIFKKVTTVLEQYGKIKDSYLKRFTIFFLLSYGEADRNIKVEINTRMLLLDLRQYYEIKDYLGIPMLVSKKDYLFGSKLVALTQRRETALRDIYDIWFFAKNNWEINTEIIKARTGKDLKDYLSDCIKVIARVKDNQMLEGLGELLNEQDKKWVKKNLRSEVIFLLKNYQSVIK